VRLGSVRATALLATSILLLSAGSASGASGTGGAAYNPDYVSPGSVPSSGTTQPPIGQSGGAAYYPKLAKGGTYPKPETRNSPPTRDISRPSSDLHVFPVAGPHSYGGADARFGAGRPGHRHQGQDILAAEGTPVLAPRGGTITWRAFQAKGAGYYLVLDPVMEPYNYVFMHLQAASLLVKLGDRVRTGQLLANVGSTGTASAPHLHFEIWNGPWYKGGVPIDPLPILLAWDRATGKAPASR
jgi:murein DD-endopeptidase MepM/ murein hydrolase activator NlpD